MGDFMFKRNTDKSPEEQIVTGWYSLKESDYPYMDAVFWRLFSAFVIDSEASYMWVDIFMGAMELHSW